MRVPDNVVAGNATITVSFPDWKEGKVAPATFEMTIEEAALSVKKEPRDAVASGAASDGKRDGKELSAEVVRLLYRLFAAETQAQFYETTDRIAKLNLPQRMAAMDELARLMRSGNPGIRRLAADAMSAVLNETSGKAEMAVIQGKEIDGVANRDARVVIADTIDYRIYVPAKELNKIRPTLEKWWSERRKKYLDAGN